MPEPTAKQRPTYSWWVIPVALSLMVLMSTLVPHLLRKRVIQRLQHLGADVERSSPANWWIPIDRVPGLQNLSRVPQLLRIGHDCSAAQCSEALRLASPLNTIRELDLTDSPATDKDLENLSTWPELEALSISGTRITDHGLKSLAQVSHLKVLLLNNCNVTDAGLGHTSHLQALEMLDLSGTQVTDVGLKHLAGLKNLQYLGLSNTQVSESAIHDLSAARPQLQVTDD